MIDVDKGGEEGNFSLKLCWHNMWTFATKRAQENITGYPLFKPNRLDNKAGLFESIFSRWEA